MILCEHGPGGTPALFDGASRIIVAQTPDAIAPALLALDAARAGGAWIAGYVGYEAGLAMEPRLAGLMAAGTGEPLA